VLPGERHSATNPVTGITSTVALVSKPWGTQVTMDLSRLHGPLTCQLVAVSKTGQRAVLAGWKVPVAGYGVPGHPAHLVLDGSSPFQMKDMSRILVQVVHGRTLVSIPV
jgi:hypothetical protein